MILGTGGRVRSWAGTAIGWVALAVATLLSVQGCAPATPADAAPGVGHALTLAAAQAAYDSYLAASDAAAAQGDQKQSLSIAAYAQWALAKGQYTALTSTGMPVPRYRYGKPVFYVPALSGYPQWFMVAVPRRTGTGASLGAAVNTVMVFERETPKRLWTLAGSAVLDHGLPAIARDRGGYAIAVPDAAQGLLLTPDVVGATQAAVVDDGPASPAAAVVGSGPQTTGFYAAQAARVTSDAARGLQYQWLLQGTSYRQFQLRTADGGALVLYGMYLTTVTQHPNLVAGPPIPAPADVVPLFVFPNEIGFHAVWANWTYEFAAIDPPSAARNAKLTVIAADGGPTYGHAA